MQFLFFISKNLACFKKNNPCQQSCKWESVSAMAAATELALAAHAPLGARSAALRRFRSAVPAAFEACTYSVRPSKATKTEVESGVPVPYPPFPLPPFLPPFSLVTRGHLSSAARPPG